MNTKAESLSAANGKWLAIGSLALMSALLACNFMAWRSLYRADRARPKTTGAAARAIARVNHEPAVAFCNRANAFFFNKHNKGDDMNKDAPDNVTALCRIRALAEMTLDALTDGPAETKKAEYALREIDLIVAGQNIGEVK